MLCLLLEMECSTNLARRVAIPSEDLRSTYSFQKFSLSKMPFALCTSMKRMTIFCVRWWCEMKFGYISALDGFLQTLWLTDPICTSADVNAYEWHASCLGCKRIHSVPQDSVFRWQRYCPHTKTNIWYSNPAVSSSCDLRCSIQKFAMMGNINAMTLYRLHAQVCDNDILTLHKITRTLKQQIYKVMRNVVW